jgi:hypothetical protein
MPSSEPDTDPTTRTDRPLPPLLAVTAGVAVGVLVVTLGFGAWTVTAFLVPWVAAIGLVVLPIVLDRIVVRRRRSVWLGAAVGAGLGILGVGILLVVQPMAGMAGPLLPVLAVVIGGLLGTCGTAIGPRVRSPRVAGALIALAIAAPVVLAIVGRP